MEERSVDVIAKSNSKVKIKVIPGHFATTNSHVNCYIDMTGAKIQHKMARLIAKELSVQYIGSVSVDSIICMESTEMIGGFLADELSSGKTYSINAGKDINVITPEVNSTGQMIFRDNTQGMIWDKDVVLLIASATTGKTINRATECIRYYNGNVAGISAIFSAIDSLADIEINRVFGSEDLTGYATYSSGDCPYCKAKVKIDAIVNSYGYSKI